MDQVNQMIGICGGSSSGKTTLGKSLASKISLTDLTIVHFDDFMIHVSKLDVSNITNWESPSLYRFDDFEKALKELKEGRVVEIEANSREAKKEGVTARILTPNKYMLVEGFLIFHTQESRNHFDKRIFIDLPEDEIVKRRYERMKGKEGFWNSYEYISTILVEEHRKVVLPQKQYADLVLDGTKTTEYLLQETLEFIDTIPS
jgi:uridine kinase